MTNEEKILALLEAQQIELKNINTKIGTMQEDIGQLKEDVTQLKEDVAQLKEDVDQLKEDSEITRSGVNTLIEWAEEVSETISFPLPKLK